MPYKEKAINSYIVITHFIHYFAVVAAVSINAIGVGIGQGLTGVMGINALNIQPAAHNEVNKIALFGAALIETAAVLGSFMAVVLLMGSGQAEMVPLRGFAEIGIVLALCIPGFTLGIVTALPAKAACLATARQPFYGDKIMRFMIVCISLMQTPVIFGFIISLIMFSQLNTIVFWQDVLRIIGAGLAIGLGSIGPAIGLGLFTYKTCNAIGIRRKSYDSLFSFSLMRIAVIETPVIFALVISLLLLFVVQPATEEHILAGIGFLSAGITVGIGTLGAGISSARTAAAAAHAIALNPENGTAAAHASLISQGMIEASVIYPTIIALFLIFLNMPG